MTIQMTQEAPLEKAQLSRRAPPAERWGGPTRRQEGDGDREIGTEPETGKDNGGRGGCLSASGYTTWGQEHWFWNHRHVGSGSH